MRRQRKTGGFIQTIFILAAATFASTSAWAQDSFVGYQLGYVQGAAGSQSNDPFQFDNDLELTNTLDSPLVSRFAGFQFTSQVTGNLTLDIPGQILEQSFLLGAAFDQQLPYQVPEDAREDLRQAQSGFIANANYLLRHVRPTYGVALNLGYAFTQNGRLANNAGGGGGIQNNTLPGATALNGMLSITDDTQTGNVEAQFEITKQSWDLSIQPRYVYTDNGVYNLLDNGPPGITDNAGLNVGAVTCNGVINLTTTGTITPGCFVIASSHDLSFSVENRIRLNRRNNLNSELNLQWFIPVLTEEDRFQSIPETLIAEAQIGYLYNPSGRRNFGLSIGGVNSLRSPEDPFLNGQEAALSDELRADTLIYRSQLLYNDRIRAAELDVAFSVGLAQAVLYQPPLGALPAPECFLAGGCDDNAQLLVYTVDHFSPIRAEIEPEFRINLRRRFEPFNLELTLLREVGVGALGASALVTTGGAFNLRHVLRLGERRAMVSNLGINYADVQAIGQSLFLGFDDVDQWAAQLENRVLAINAAVAIPLFEVGGMVVDANLTYNLTYIDQDPTGDLRQFQDLAQAETNQIDRLGNIGPPVPLQPTHTQVGLLTIRAVWGRGTLQTGSALGGGGGGSADPYGQDPRSGAALGSARLIDGEQPLLDGTAGPAPGLPPDAQSDRERFTRSKSQKKIENKNNARGKVLNQNKTAQQEAEDAEKAEEEKQKKAKKKRSREFDDWPVEPK